MSDCHIILDEAQNPILYEYGRLHQMGDPTDISSVTSMNICSFGNMLISLLRVRVDEEERNLLHSDGIQLDGDTWSSYKMGYSFFACDRSRFWMNPICFVSHPYFYRYDAHKLFKLTIRCISNCVDERPSINEIVGKFNKLFYISIHVSCSLPINCNIVEEFKFCKIRKITGGFTTLIGETQFGYLYWGSYGGTRVTVKVFRDTPTISAMYRRTLHPKVEDKIHRLKDEILLLRDKRSSSFPYLPNLIAFCCENEGVALVYDFQTECTLHSFIADDKANWASRINVIYQVARLLQCMHNYDPYFIVGNISSHHLLLDKDMRMVIVDFGLLTGGFLGVKKVHKYQMYEGATGYVDERSQFVGSWNKKIDVYAFGVLLVELLNKCRMVDCTTMLDSPLLYSLQRHHWMEQDGPLPTETAIRNPTKAVINNSFKSDQFYYDDDASDLVTIALGSISYSLKRWDVNEIIHQLDGLMLYRPSKDMCQALQKNLS